MGEKYLGERFDILAVGLVLMFPLRCEMARVVPTAGERRATGVAITW